MLRLALLVLCLALVPSQGWGAQAFVQGKICAVGATAANFITCTFDSATTTGNIIVASSGYQTGTVTSITFTDDRSGSYATIQSLYSSPQVTSGAALGVGTVGTAGTTAVTATFTNSEQPDYYGICIAEFSGVNTSSIVDVSTVNSQVTPTTGTDLITSGAIVSTADGEIYYGGVWNSQNVTGTLTKGTTYTLIAVQNTGTVQRGLCEYWQQASAGSADADATTTNGDDDHITFAVAMKTAVVTALRGGMLLLGVGQ